MRKKIVYIGLALIAIAVASFFISGSLLRSSIRNAILTANVTVQAGGYSSLPLTIGNQSVLVVQATLDSPAYIYIFNNATFTRWAAAAKSLGNFSGLAYAKLITPNNSFVSNPVTIAELVYPKNISDLSSPANRSIDVVIDNTNGSPSSNSVVAGQLEWVQVGAGAVGPYQIVKVANVVMFIAGIIVVIYGVLKKMPVDASAVGANGKDGKPSPATQEYVDELYKHVDKTKAQTKRKKTSR